MESVVRVVYVEVSMSKMDLVVLGSLVGYSAVPSKGFTDVKFDGGFYGKEEIPVIWIIYLDHLKYLYTENLTVHLKTGF